MRRSRKRIGAYREFMTDQRKSPGFSVDADLIIDTVPDGLMVLDHGCRIMRWNRAMEGLSGYPSEEIQGKTCTLLDFCHPQTGERLNVERQCLLSGGKGDSSPREVECNLLHKSGERVPALIEGETGTGKELVDEAIHEESGRRAGPLVRVNCSAFSENLLESELFGHVRGAFTGAVRDKAGRIEAAEGGTLFMDEIGDVRPMIQLKLVRLLQEHEYERPAAPALRAGCEGSGWCGSS